MADGDELGVELGGDGAVLGDVDERAVRERDVDAGSRAVHQRDRREPDQPRRHLNAVAPVELGALHVPPGQVLVHPPEVEARHHVQRPVRTLYSCKFNSYF